MTDSTAFIRGHPLLTADRPHGSRHRVVRSRLQIKLQMLRLTRLDGHGEPHQVVLVAGKGGCGFSGMTITGVPDPVWLKEFLGE